MLLNDGQIIRIVQHIDHKALVDFQYSGRQSLEIGERRIIGAEVTQCKGDPKFQAGIHQLGYIRDVVKYACSQYFKFQIGVWNIGAQTPFSMYCTAR